MVLISSDGDYAYLLSRLRDVGVKCVVIHGRNCASVLLQSADAVLHWEDDVLGHGLGLGGDVGGNAGRGGGWDGWDAPAAPLAAAPDSPLASARGTEGGGGWGDAPLTAAPMAALAAAVAAPEAAAAPVFGGSPPAGNHEDLMLPPFPPTGPPGPMVRAESMSSDSSFHGRHKLLLNCVAELTAQAHEGWCTDAALSQMWFRRKGYAPGARVLDDHRAQYRALKQSALGAGFLEARALPHQIIRLTQGGAAAEAQDDDFDEVEVEVEDEPPPTPRAAAAAHTERIAFGAFPPEPPPPAALPPAVPGAGRDGIEEAHEEDAGGEATVDPTTTGAAGAEALPGAAEVVFAVVGANRQVP